MHSNPTSLLNCQVLFEDENKDVFRHRRYPYGLAHLDNIVFWSEYQRGLIQRLDLKTKNVTTLIEESPPVFQIKVFDIAMQTGKHWMLISHFPIYTHYDIILRIHAKYFKLCIIFILCFLFYNFYVILYSKWNLMPSVNRALFIIHIGINISKLLIFVI